MAKMEKLAVEELPLEGVGPRLRRAREERGLALAQIAEQTKIPMRHLEVIERGAFSELPARTYAIGFTRTYAGILGLDEKDITAGLRAELGDASAAQVERIPGFEPGDPAKTPSAMLAWSAAIAAVVLLAGAVMFYRTFYGAGADPAPLVVQTQAPPAASVPVQAAPPTAGGAVELTALEDGIWVRIYDVSGARLLEKQLMSGERFMVPADAQEPRINTGRPDALAITVDGKPVPKLAETPRTVGDMELSASALLSRGATPPAPALN